MLSALEDRPRWLALDWSPFLVTSSEDPAEVLARQAARHGTHAAEELRAVNLPDFRLWAARLEARRAWRFALAAVALDERARLALADDPLLEDTGAEFRISLDAERVS